MESRSIKRNVALVEKCAMSSVGIKSLFNTMPDNQYELHIFSSQPAFSQVMLKTSFSAVIFSLCNQNRSQGWVSLSDGTGCKFSAYSPGGDC